MTVLTQESTSPSVALSALFEVQRDGNTLVVSSAGQLDAIAHDEFTAAVTSLAESFTPGITAVVVDLRNISAPPDRLIGPLIVLWKRVRNQHGKLAVCGLCKYGREVLTRSRLHLLWTICHSREEALQAVGRA